ncbi:MAG TPA: toxin TcdB middle/C-terminal domain-containing protein, partial [Flavobacteriales bacterium]|nr:toxin TcdB middle/C-terminal domain-containing protein [Flavobacteriales bacterium]
MKFIDLMKNGKPHLLIKTENNLGAETLVQYKPSTYFYFKDKNEGKPWITRLAFPVHVVERVETYDRISRNHFVTRYAYHHGYFDGPEREFRGFGMVEQFDTERFTALTNDPTLPDVTNVDLASHVPPMHTKTWFHTGAFLHGERISQQMAHEYFREPAMRAEPGDSDATKQAKNEAFKKLLLDDTVLPDDLNAHEAREAVRSLKGSILRQEVYADDDGPKKDVPYSVSERNYTIKCLQPRSGNEHAVFFTHANETIDFHYERNTADPRISHSITLEMDEYGNVLKSATIGYGRRIDAPDLADADDRKKQKQTLVTYTENEVTNAIDDADDRRTPLPATADTFELTGFTATGPAGRFAQADLVALEPLPNSPRPRRYLLVPHTGIDYEVEATNGRQKRLIERLRSYYRADDLTRRLDLKEAQPLALPYESYKLALTASLVGQVFKRGRTAVKETLVLDAPGLLEGTGPDGGGYTFLDGDHTRWWISSGRVFYLDVDDPAPAAEFERARTHFFLPRSFKDPFRSLTTVNYDPYDLAVITTRDALGNTVSARNDYRV